MTNLYVKPSGLRKGLIEGHPVKFKVKKNYFHINKFILYFLPPPLYVIFHLKLNFIKSNYMYMVSKKQVQFCNSIVGGGGYTGVGGI